MKHLILLATILATLVVSVAHADEPAAEDPANVAAARELFEQALRDSEAGNWESAREKLERAATLKRAPIILDSLAAAEKQTGRLAGSLEHFRQFLALPVEPRTEQFVEPAQAAVAELEPRVPRATLVVRPQPAGLKVTLDGGDIALAALGVARPVDPGEHELAAEAPGHAPARQAFTLAEGAAEEVTLVLTPKLDDGAEPAGDPAERAPEGDQESDAFPVVPVTLLAGGGALALVGVGVGIAGIVEGDGVMKGTAEADEARKKTIAGDVVGGVGAVAAGIGLILLLTGDDDAAAAGAGALAPRPWLGPNTSGIALRF